MYIKLTRIDGREIWLNAAFIVTVEPTRSGGSIVVPIGDGLDYEVRESPATVLSMLEGAPVPEVVPVPPPKSLAPQPEDVSPDDMRGEQVDETPPAEQSAPAADAPKTHGKRGRRKKQDDAKQPPAAPQPPAPPQPPAQQETEDFKEIVADLKARKCRTGKRLRNAIKSYFKKTDEVEIDGIIEAMINGGYMLVGADGHVTWIESPEESNG